MKKLVLVLLLIPLVSFGQEETTVNLNKTIKYADTNGLQSLEGGTYSIQVNNEWLGKKKRIKRAMLQITEFSKNNNSKYKILNTDHWYSATKITFALLNNDGTLMIGKSDAKKQLLELKKYLDLGIITQEEFDKKAVSLKKILLGN